MWKPHTLYSKHKRHVNFSICLVGFSSFENIDSYDKLLQHINNKYNTIQYLFTSVCHISVLTQYELKEKWPLLQTQISWLELTCIAILPPAAKSSWRPINMQNT